MNISNLSNKEAHEITKICAWPSKADCHILNLKKWIKFRFTRAEIQPSTIMHFIKVQQDTKCDCIWMHDKYQHFIPFIMAC